MNIEEKYKNGQNNMIGSWRDINKFLENKKDLGNLLKTFSFIEIRNIYLEGKDRGVVKKYQEKLFLNILTRMRLKIPLTKTEFNEITPFYIAIMEEIISEEKQSEIIDNSIEKTEERKLSKTDEEIMDILF